MNKIAKVEITQSTKSLKEGSVVLAFVIDVEDLTTRARFKVKDSIDEGGISDFVYAVVNDEMETIFFTNRTCRVMKEYDVRDLNCQGYAPNRQPNVLEIVNKGKLTDFIGENITELDISVKFNQEGK